MFSQPTGIPNLAPFAHFSEYIEDDLPLPSFQEVFGFTVNAGRTEQTTQTNTASKSKKKSQEQENTSSNKRLRLEELGLSNPLHHDSG
jgi:hypothetical protein